MLTLLMLLVPGCFSQPSAAAFAPGPVHVDTGIVTPDTGTSEQARLQPATVEVRSERRR